MQRREPPRLNLAGNLQGYYLAIGLIALGYLFMAIGGADSFTSKTLGPLVMVIGFIVAVPAALLRKAPVKATKKEAPASAKKK